MAEKVINGIDMTKETLTGKEVCAVFGFTRQTLNRRISDGVLIPLPRPIGFQRRPELRFNTNDVLAYREKEVERFKAENS